MRFDSSYNPAEGAKETAAYDAPEVCPACRSALIMTTSKSADAQSYWRCTTCGEVWNHSRRNVLKYRGR